MEEMTAEEQIEFERKLAIDLARDFAAMGKKEQEQFYLGQASGLAAALVHIRQSK